MSDERKDGGPAFPNRIRFGPDGQCANSNAEIAGGMSLRDYFASAALQGMLCNGFIPSTVSQHGCVPFDYPGAAYELADAMLKAGAK